MKAIITAPGRIAALLGAATFFIALPYQFPGTADGAGWLPAAATAFADSGKGSGGSGRSDDDDDRSGHSDDDDDDRSGGSGGSSSGGGSGGGSSSGGTSGSASGGSTDDGTGRRATKVEVSSGGIEVRFSDGTKEEIENGRFERKNAAGRTVEERPATQADFDRLLGGGSTGGTVGGGTGGTVGGGTGGSTGGSAGVSKVEVSSAGIEVRFTDGTKQEIENGRFERKNAAGRTVEERPATQADFDRLFALR